MSEPEAQRWRDEQVASATLLSTAIAQLELIRLRLDTVDLRLSKIELALALNRHEIPGVYETIRDLQEQFERRYNDIAHNSKGTAASLDTAQSWRDKITGAHAVVWAVGGFVGLLILGLLVEWLKIKFLR